MVGPASIVLIMITGLTSAKPSGNLRKQDLLLTSPGVYMASQRATQKVVDGERGRKCRFGALPLFGSKGGKSKVSRVHFLLVNSKHIKVGIRAWEGRIRVTPVISSLGYSRPF